MFYILRHYDRLWLVREREDGTWEEALIDPFHVAYPSDYLLEEYASRLKWQGEHNLQKFVKENKNCNLIPLKLRTKTLIEEKVRNLEYPH